MMPSPSPLAEATTESEALRLAQARHGDQAPIRVRPVRSGGVLGFFATERFVAEPDVAIGGEAAAEGPDLDTALADLQDLFADDAATRPQAVTYTPPTVAPVRPGPTPPGTPSKPVAAPSPFAAALARVLDSPEVTDAVEGAVSTAEPAPPVPVSGTGGPYPLSAALVTDRGAVEAPPLGPRAGLARTDDHECLVARLGALGVSPDFLPDGFVVDAAERGAHAALTRALRMRLPDPPELPVEPGSSVLVFGVGLEALSGARMIATALRGDPARVQWAAAEDLAALVPAGQRIRTCEEAERKARAARRSAGVTVVAVDARTSGSAGAGWARQILDAWPADAAWAVADATRKPGDVARWAEWLPRVDALSVHHTRDSADPATFLVSPVAPVGLVDGVRASAAAWATLLCERLDETDTANA